MRGLLVMGVSMLHGQHKFEGTKEPLDASDIYHTLKSEHECTLLKLPRAMAPMVIFP
jgi:hypothetical protein